MNLTEINLNTSGNIILLILLILIAIGFSYYVYRKTVPPVSKSLRIILMSLRAVVVILVVLLLFEPILSVTRKKQEKPVIAVLIDHSASMGLVDQNVDRTQVLQSILGSEFFQKKNNNYEKVFYPFSYKLLEGTNIPPDSLNLSGDGTDIRAALAELKEKLAEQYFTSV
ncbi:MAG: hypothetical protein ACE5HX_15835, partial [bacterium]